MDKRTRLILIVTVAAIVAAIVLFVIVPLLLRIGKVNITVLTSPQSSSFTVDDQSSGIGSIWVTPGSHTLKATHQYFKDKTITVDTTQIDTKKAVYVILDTDGEQGEKWLRDHPEDQLIREGYGGQKAAEIQNTLSKNFPIVDKLPHETTDYKIELENYDVAANKLHLNIALYAVLNRSSQMTQYKADLKAYQAEALKFLTDNGLSLDNVVISYDPDPNQ